MAALQGKATHAVVHWLRFPAVTLPQELELSTHPADALSWKIGPDGLVAPDGNRFPSAPWCGVSLGAGGVALTRSSSEQFLVQATGVLTCALWSAAATFAITKLVAVVVGLRVDRDSETQGLDFAAHGETGYHVGR